MLVILSKNCQSPKFTPRQYFILYGNLNKTMQANEALRNKTAINTTCKYDGHPTFHRYIFNNNKPWCSNI